MVDVAVDQGGCIETCRPTTHDHPTYVVHGVVHYCVANMPGAVPQTSTFALTNVTRPYARRDRRPRAGGGHPPGQGARPWTEYLRRSRHLRGRGPGPGPPVRPAASRRSRRKIARRHARLPTSRGVTFFRQSVTHLRRWAVLKTQPSPVPSGVGRCQGGARILDFRHNHRSKHEFEELALAAPRPALLGGAAADQERARRRGPRAGHLPARLPLLRQVRARHQHQGLALQDPHQHLHQPLPPEGEGAERRRGLRARGRPRALHQPGRERLRRQPRAVLLRPAALGRRAARPSTGCPSTSAWW